MYYIIIKIKMYKITTITETFIKDNNVVHSFIVKKNNITY